MADLEQQSEGHSIENSLVQTLSWSDVTVSVKDKSTGEPRDLLYNVDGCVKAGMWSTILICKKTTLTWFRRGNGSHGSIRVG